MNLSTLRRPGSDDDAGMAMVMVTGIMAVLMVFLLTGLAYVLNNVPASRRDQDAKAAYAAAEAGLEEYIARLNANSNYWQVGNTDSTNPALTATGLGVEVPGTSGRARFRYQQVSTMASTVSGRSIRMQVTGLSGPDDAHMVKSTITATLTPSGFLNYVYFSNFEVIDPGLNLAVQNPGCTGNYRPARAALGSGACLEIQWATGDVVQGPLHSNDALQINGSVLFQGTPTETAIDMATPNLWWGSGAPAGGSVAVTKGQVLALPASNGTITNWVDPNPVTAADAANHGCMYSGATRIIFEGTSMRILSPATSDAATPTRCLDVANRASWQVISPIPSVIYVQPTAGACASVGFPIANEVASSLNEACSRGTAYVQGDVNDQVTVAAGNDIVVTGNLRTTSGAPSGTDVIGLVANNYVWVYHPVNNSGNNILPATKPAGTPTPPYRVHYIDAAILAVNGSFVVQNHGSGTALSTSGTTSSYLNVTGAIAQNYRGPVGTSGGSWGMTGYFKNYVYDARLPVNQPPHFLQPVGNPWKATSITDRRSNLG